MSDKYLKRTTVLFKKGDKFDEELLEMLTSVTSERYIGAKLKELASEYLKMSQPKLYQQVVDKLSNAPQVDNVVKSSAKAKDDSKMNDGIRSNLRKFL